MIGIIVFSNTQITMGQDLKKELPKDKQTSLGLYVTST